jgi:hypothetical protein
LPPVLAVPTERPSPRRVWPQIRGLQPLCVPVPPASARISPLFLDSREAGPRAPPGRRQSRPVDVAEEGPLRRNECTLRGKGGKRSDRNLDLYQARVVVIVEGGLTAVCTGTTSRWLLAFLRVARQSTAPMAIATNTRVKLQDYGTRGPGAKRACLMSGPPGRCTLTSNPAAICPGDTARCR